jgi:hypothetical protein
VKRVEALRCGVTNEECPAAPETRGGQRRTLRFSPAASVHDGRAVLLVLLLADPELVERAQTGEDGAAEPCGVAPLDGVARAVDLDLLLRVGQASVSVSAWMNVGVTGYSHQAQQC